MSERRDYIVRAVKIPYAARNVAHQVITADDDRGFFNIIGAEDEPDAESVLPVGADVSYRVSLTDEEAEQFRAASNCRDIQLDTVMYHDVGAVSIPAASSMRFMRADFPRIDQYHGRDVTVAVVDGGTTAAVRNYMGWTLVARKVFSTDDPGADEITSTHGCLVAPNAVPAGGRLLDAIISNNDGSSSTSAMMAAFRWAVDNGAKVINNSNSGPTQSTAIEDALNYARDRGVQIFCSCGNTGANAVRWPAGYSQTYANVHSSINFDEQTGARWSSSTYFAAASGCAPGAGVASLSPTAELLAWNGTSASTPHMASLCARGCTGNRFTPTQVGAALKANTRDTGQPNQGGGAYSLEAALTALGGFTNLPAPTFRRNLNPNPSFEVNTTGYTATASRTGIIATATARASALATPFGTSYAFTNVTGDGTTDTETPDAEIALPTCAVTAGQSYTFSVHSRHSLAGASMEWLVRFQNGSGTVLAEVSSGRQPLLVTVWPRYHVTATAPAGATQAVLFLLGSGFTDATARSWRWDGFHYEQTATLQPYFDGSTVGAVWEGTASNSTSTVGTPAPTGTGGGGTTVPPGSTTGAVLVIKAPTGVNTISGNLWYATTGAAGLVSATGAYRRTGVGPQLVMLERANVGIAGDPLETDGTGLSITGVPGDVGLPTSPGGGTGGGGGTGTTNNPGDLLRVGLDRGFAKANIGIGFVSGDPLDRDGDGHVDFTLAEIGNGLVVPGHFEMTPDNLRVRLTVPASAGTTSSRTANPRTEFRELQQSGDGSSSHPKAAWDPTRNDHKCFTRDRVVRAPAQKPQIVMIQTHDADDDTSMLRYHSGQVQCRIGDTVLSIGSIPWNLNTDYDKGIQVTAGRVRFWFGPVGAPVVIYEGNFGWTTPQYYKWGNYLQANESNVDPDEYSVTEMSACMCWHTGDPEPAVTLG
jgi:hypothetical protein